MGTSLYNSIIFGPIHSRRLGLSLGINLLLPSAKLCSFDCVYCECGWNKEHPHGAFNKEDEVYSELESTLIRMTQNGENPDVITFAGNGEPTLHPSFRNIIEETIKIRDKIVPKCKIAVLTNSTMIYKEDVRNALFKVDMNITKFDSAIYDTYLAINNPKNPVTIEEQINRLKAFNGTNIIQTMFISGGHINGKCICNTSDEEVAKWVDAISRIKPREVMLYSLDRDTPCQTIEKASVETMSLIAERIKALNIPTLVRS